MVSPPVEACKQIRDLRVIIAGVWRCPKTSYTSLNILVFHGERARLFQLTVGPYRQHVSWIKAGSFFVIINVGSTSLLSNSHQTFGDWLQLHARTIREYRWEFRPDGRQEDCEFFRKFQIRQRKQPDRRVLTGLSSYPSGSPAQSKPADGPSTRCRVA